MVHEASEMPIRDEEICLADYSRKAIFHPLRLKILCEIAKGECAAQEIVVWVGTSQSNVSQHLAILREKEILIARKDANRVYVYRLGHR